MGSEFGGLKPETLKRYGIPQGEPSRDVFADYSSDEDGKQQSLPTPPPETGAADTSLGVNFSNQGLKDDHELRPLWVCPNRHIFLETFSPLYSEAYDFLIAISEPLCRPELIHEYEITPYSLMAAASLGLDTNDIISGLQRFSKLTLDRTVADYIIEHTARCGKVKLLLREGRYFLESRSSDVLDSLLTDPAIANARVDAPTDAVTDVMTGYYTEMTEFSPSSAVSKSSESNGEDDIPEPEQVYLIEINDKDAEQVKEVIHNLGYPMLEEYDFRRDTATDDLDIKLKTIAKLRNYQEKSLSKMFGNGRARSGIIVLPCGAGKTLVGVTAIATMNKSCIIFCCTSVSCDQWQKQLMYWSTISSSDIVLFTAQQKQQIPSKACIVITTYHEKGSRRSQKIYDALAAREWGLVIMDEVHMAPAKTFRRCVGKFPSRCRLGMTATLLREDDLITDLYYLVGPKLYEANWLDLQRDGYLAKVQCNQVWCDMTEDFYAYYMQESTHRKKMLLYLMNPNKFRACHYLVRLHEERGDKIIVFSDNIFVLEHYAKAMKRPYICGSTTDSERKEWLSQLNTGSSINVLFMSRIGDVAIDLPDVNVLIQISSYYSSRRQEAQRLGRILRPKIHHGDEFNAFYYSLVSTDTQEVVYATRRQSYLMDQGYAFHIVKNLVEDNAPGILLSTTTEQRAVLVKVLTVGDKVQLCEDGYDGSDDDMENEIQRAGTAMKVAQRRRGNLAALSGGNLLTFDAFTERQRKRKREQTVEAGFYGLSQYARTRKMS